MMLVLHKIYTTRFTEVGRWLWPRTLTKAIKGFAHICQHCSLLVSDFVGFLLTRIAAATIIGFWYLLGYALCLFLESGKFSQASQFSHLKSRCRVHLMNSILRPFWLKFFLPLRATLRFARPSPSARFSMGRFQAMLQRLKILTRRW